MVPFFGGQLGPYHVIRRIGSGGMGEVYLAEDRRMGITRQVAIKTIRVEADSAFDQEATQEAERLFRREMQAITTMDHPFILPLYDYGEEQLEGTILTYMVMPFRPEGSLATWLQKREKTEPLSLDEAAHFVGQASQALYHAHTHGLIHQDVKPANFLLRNRSDQLLPDILLSDFGIVKMATTTATTSQSIRGTPAYMAPEQWNGHPVPATDQYALAVMAYLLLTRQYPFKGGMEQVMRQHLDALPQAPSLLNHTIPPDLDAVLLQALRKSPVERFATIAAFGNAFQQALQPSVTRLSTSGPGPLADARSVATISPTEAVVPFSAKDKSLAADASVVAEPEPISPLSATVASSSSSNALTEKGPFFPVSHETVQARDTATIPSAPHERPEPARAGGGTLFRSRTAVLLIVSLLVLFVLAGVIGIAVYLGQPTSHNPPVVGSTATTQPTAAQTPAVAAWHVQQSGTIQKLAGVAYAVSSFVAVGQRGTILTSPDGNTWHVRASHTLVDLNGVAYGGALIVAVGQKGTILTSPNGNIWRAQLSHTSEDLRGVGCDRAVAFFCVAVGEGGTILASSDGRDWHVQTSHTSSALNAVSCAGVVTFYCVAVGQGGTILTSPNKESWTAQSSGTSSDLYSIARFNADSTVVGQGGTILVSDLGDAWTSHTSGTSQDLYGIGRTLQQFMAVGRGGTILNSDGIDWTDQTSNTSDILYSIAGNSSQFVAVGQDGIILTWPQ